MIPNTRCALANRVVRTALPFVVLVSSSVARGDVVTHQITGLCMKEREPDLRETFAKIPDIKLARIDFDNAQVQLEYDPAKPFSGTKPDQIVQRLDGMVKSASNHIFAIKPLRTTPLNKLRLIEFPVAGLDCKACSLAAYEAIYKIDGVEKATASFREGRVAAWIEERKTDRASLEAALKNRGVQVKTP